MALRHRPKQRLRKPARHERAWDPQALWNGLLIGRPSMRCPEDKLCRARCQKSLLEPKFYSKRTEIPGAYPYLEIAG